MNLILEISKLLVIWILNKDRGNLSIGFPAKSSYNLRSTDFQLQFSIMCVLRTDSLCWEPSQI